MKPGTDQDMFITRVWHLAEQLESVGEKVSDERRADIILQDLSAEYDLIRSNANADTSYDTEEISQTARKI